MATKKYQPKTRDELKALCDDPTIHLGDIDTSLITDMSELFKHHSIRKDYSGIESWDVSNVITMEAMFHCSSFNEPIEQWDVSKVRNMRHLFSHTQFNQPLNGWDVSNVETMDHMFYDSPFNQPIDSWDVRNVQNMSAMFGHSCFNQPLNSWKTDRLENIAGIFIQNEYFNHPLDKWDVSKVTNMNCAFSGSVFNQPLNSWDVSNATSMSHMFEKSLFNQPLDNWDVSNVSCMREMFARSCFNQPIGNWNVKNLTSAYGMFASSKFNQPLNWVLSKQIEVDGMFYNTPYEHDIRFLFGFAHCKFSDFISHENKYMTELLKKIADDLEPFGKYELDYDWVDGYYGNVYCLKDTEFDGVVGISYSEIFKSPEEAINKALRLALSLEEEFKTVYFDNAYLKENVAKHCFDLRKIRGYHYFRLQEMYEYLKECGYKIRAGKLKGDLLYKILVEKSIKVDNRRFDILRMLVLEQMRELELTA